MIYLYSGTPGSGKSLHAASDIYEALKNGSRKLVITNFTINRKALGKFKNELLVIPNLEMTVERLQSESVRFFKKHYGGKVHQHKILLYIDEAAQLFNARSYTDKGRNRWCTFFSEHRKFGFDVYLIAQFDRMLDKQIRSNIEYNMIHRRMLNYGIKGVFLYVIMFGRQYAVLQEHYPTKERTGNRFFRGKKKYMRIYDTFEVFSDQLIKKDDETLNENAEPEETSGMIKQLINKIRKKEDGDMVRETAAEIFTELDKEDRVNWFDLKEKKFLHTIDTFYYSVKLHNDFTSKSEDPVCLEFRKYFSNLKSRFTYSDDAVEVFCPGMDRNLSFVTGHFDQFYNLHLQDPKLFDIFIAEVVPPGQDGESVTSEIVVQIRSQLLWQYGVTKAFEYTYEKFVVPFCEYFKLSIKEVKENRTDYCWHTNYFQRPEKFFAPDKFSNMFVSRLGSRDGGNDVNYRFTCYKDGSYETNYIAMGNRGETCFLRIYDKTKEVVQMGYKGWFLQEWLFNGMINRYDFFVLEKCYKMQRWGYLDKARLEWYLEYGKKEFYKKDIRAILDGVVTPDSLTIKKLADKLTPKVTKVINIEYQTMRKMTKSIVIKHKRDNASKGVARRIYDYFDMRGPIVEYLTHDTFRLINRTEENKSRCDYCAFWKALRNAKLIDVKKDEHDVKLQRDYSRNLDAEVVRKRALSASISYSLYVNGLNDFSAVEDAADMFCILNDNDIEYMNRTKEKRKKQLNKLLYDKETEGSREKNYSIILHDTGEIF